MKNYYHRLEDKFYFFSVLLHTQNERVFKKCYELLTGEKEKKDSKFAINIIKDEPYYKQFRSGKK